MVSPVCHHCMHCRQSLMNSMAGHAEQHTEASSQTRQAMLFVVFGRKPLYAAHVSVLHTTCGMATRSRHIIPSASLARYHACLCVSVHGLDTTSSVVQVHGLLAGLIECVGSCLWWSWSALSSPGVVHYSAHDHAWPPMPCFKPVPCI